MNKTLFYQSQVLVLTAALLFVWVFVSFLHKQTDGATYVEITQNTKAN